MYNMLYLSDLIITVEKTYVRADALLNLLKINDGLI